MKRYDIINHFINSRGYFSFLEIGTAGGETYRNVMAPVKVSVDPDPTTNPTFCGTSDEFFEWNFQCYDIIFIDGLHEHNQVYRDIHTALQVLERGGVIVLHDCLPTSKKMQEHKMTSQYGYAWTGDVWKAFVKERSKSPFLMYTVDTDFGCGVIDTAYEVVWDDRGDVRAGLPSDMETMTYEQFVQNRNNWMNVKGEIING